MIYSYNTNEIFEEMPNDPDHVIMKFPEKLMEELGWAEGDTLVVGIDDEKLVITRYAE